MMDVDDSIRVLNNLPIRTRPVYTFIACLETLAEITEEAHDVIKPSFFRKLLGGVSSDHARATLAACNAEASAVYRVISKLEESTNNQAFTGNLEKDNKSRLISGYCVKLLKSLNSWMEAAREFESAAYGSQKLITIENENLTKAHQNIHKAVSQFEDNMDFVKNIANPH